MEQIGQTIHLEDGGRRGEGTSPHKHIDGHGMEAANGTGPVPPAEPNPSVVPDFPAPRSLQDQEESVWNEDDQAVNNYCALGKRLAAAGDLYRQPAYAAGLLMASDRPDIEPTVIASGRHLASVIVDRVRVRVTKGGNTKGRRIPSGHLDDMLRTEVFLREFRPIDAVVRTAIYLPGFHLARPGYNDGGRGMRLLYVGPEVRVDRSPEAITAFLDVMEFDTKADRTNAVAAALTVLLRHFWAGGKPLIALTSTKSHGGKNTVIQFAAGAAPLLSLTYESTDWAFEQNFTAGVKHRPDVGVVHVDNARLGKGGRFIASGFLEGFLTNTRPLLQSPGTGKALEVNNQLVVALSTNYGAISEDLLNRALPIHLAPRGDVASRNSPIGNPKLEYLPAHRGQIEAELCGMIERWKEAGRPLDEGVKHPFTEWARTIGGILRVNGYAAFLGNYTMRRTADDPLRRGLGLLGAAKPNAWLRSADWARLAANLGLVKAVIPEADRATDAGHERGIGVVLSAHAGETFVAEDENERLTLKLEKARRRFDGKEPSTRYQFQALDRLAIPEDPPQDDKTSGLNQPV